MCRNTLMKIAGPALALLGVVALAVALWAFITLVPVERVPCPPDGCPVEAVMPDNDDLCGRYHLRKRTNRFFRRSVG